MMITKANTTHIHVTISKKIKIPRTIIITTTSNYALQLTLHHEINWPRVLNHANAKLTLHEIRVSTSIGPKQVAKVGKLHIWERELKVMRRGWRVCLVSVN